MDSKRVKLVEKEDRISSLPDSIIQHILSFLPSTKHAIRTSALSKRWEKQWTRVPVLILDFSGMCSTVSDEEFSRTSSDVARFIDNILILHDCLKIKKFHLKSGHDFGQDPNCNAKLRFALRKEVEELSLHILSCGRIYELFKLPNFFFNHASFLKLKVINCSLMPVGRVNWDCLKDLHIEECILANHAIESVISGSPLLESLEINYCAEFEFDRLVIASKSLKRLVLVDFCQEFVVLEVLCPNLEEFHAVSRAVYPCTLSDAALETLLSGSPLLEVLELVDCYDITQLVIDSKSLKKLVLVGFRTDAIVISCPNLEELNLNSMSTSIIKLMNLSSTICVTLDLTNLARMILEQLHHVKELNIGHGCIQILSALEMRSLSSPSVNCKSLTVDGGPKFAKHLPGIAYVLRNSPELERLVVNLRHVECDVCERLPDLNFYRGNYWNSNETVSNCLVSHLKIVKIISLSKEDGKLNLMFNFVEFLLKNAQILEKMVIILADGGADFELEVSKKLLSFSRLSQHAVVELLP
ncbi:F-box protein At5g03100-like [Euphorbia lathyris]|uniref:F-box protein At5g03100-like n=1 Tax=Euphorbia lathyris TaxID=212925 RepID=UPI00331381C4